MNLTCLFGHHYGPLDTDHLGAFTRCTKCGKTKYAGSTGKPVDHHSDHQYRAQIIEGRSWEVGKQRRP